jgi:F-type H+-transporting ATPase subunit gamma
MTIEALQKRIKTTRDLRDIVKTMKSLSAVNILQYDEAQKALEQYAQIVESALQGLLKQGDLKYLPTKRTRAQEKAVVILIGSDNGLVGKFNRDVLTQSDAFFEKEGTKKSDLTYLLVGKRLASLVKNKGRRVFACYPNAHSAKSVTESASLLMSDLDKLMRAHPMQRVFLFYNKRVSGQSARVQNKQLMPLNPNWIKSLKEKPWPTNRFPICSIEKNRLYSEFIKEHLMITVCGALAMSLAAEYHTRLMNMQAAEKNIDENLEIMNLKYQQERQEAITAELIDIVSASQAVNEQKNHPSKRKKIHQPVD